MAERLLIVEDDESEIELYREVFEEEGYHIDIAQDADAALAYVRAGEYDLVVLDINIPGRDGLEVLKDIMSIDRKLPVILNTAYSDYQHDYSSWAAVAYVVKTADVTELRQTVRNVLAGKQA